MTQAAPCPWCEDGGKPFLHQNGQPFFSYTVHCSKCFAQGPHAKFSPDYKRTWAQVTDPAKAEALRMWNERAQQEEEHSPVLAKVVG